jgi:hypothetical protein
LVKGIYDAIDVLGNVTTLGILTFVAYLIGSLFVWENRELHHWQTRGEREAISVLMPFVYKFAATLVSERQESRAVDINKPSDDPYIAMQIILGRGLVAGWVKRVPPNRQIEIGASRRDYPVLKKTHEVAVIILQQQTQLETRLLAEKRDVFDYYDRLKESADLRTNLALAILGLGAATAHRLISEGISSSFWVGTIAGTLVTTAALWFRGRAQFGRSQLALATAVAADVISSPLLEQWKTEYLPRRSASEETAEATDKPTASTDPD